MFADDDRDKRMACLVALTHLALSSGTILPGSQSLSSSRPLLKRREMDQRIHSSMAPPRFDVLDLHAGSIS